MNIKRKEGNLVLFDQPKTMTPRSFRKNTKEKRPCMLNASRLKFSYSYQTKNIYPTDARLNEIFYCKTSVKKDIETMQFLKDKCIKIGQHKPGRIDLIFAIISKYRLHDLKRIALKYVKSYITKCIHRQSRKVSVIFQILGKYKINIKGFIDSMKFPKKYPHKHYVTSAYVLAGVSK